MGKTLAEYDARIDELEAQIAECLSVPESGSVGGTSYSMGAGRLRDLRNELDRQQRLRLRTLNGGYALPTRRGCC